MTLQELVSEATDLLGKNPSLAHHPVQITSDDQYTKYDIEVLEFDLEEGVWVIN